MEELSEPGCRKIKIILVGDSEIGKSALLNAFVKDSFPENYEPTVFNSLTTEVEVDGERIELSLWDTSGQSEYDHVRPLSYPEADVALICFDISRPETVENAVNKWANEVKQLCAGKPVLLVGCKLDLRSDLNIISELAKSRRMPVSYQQGCELAKQINAVVYVECSAKLSDSQLQDVFEKTTLVALRKPLHQKKSKTKVTNSGKGTQRKCRGCLIT